MGGAEPEWESGEESYMRRERENSLHQPGLHAWTGPQIGSTWHRRGISSIESSVHGGGGIAHGSALANLIHHYKKDLINIYNCCREL